MTRPTEPIGSIPRPSSGSTRTSGRTRFTACRIPRQTTSRSRSRLVAAPEGRSVTTKRRALGRAPRSPSISTQVSTTRDACCRPNEPPFQLRAAGTPLLSGQSELWPARFGSCRRGLDGAPVIPHPLRAPGAQAEQDGAQIEPRLPGSHVREAKPTGGDQIACLNRTGHGPQSGVMNEPASSRSSRTRTSGRRPRPHT
jgi:hypothetical protein